MRLNTNSICLLLFTFLLSLGCKKKIILPSITTLSVSNIFANEATSGGVISSQVTGNILARGVVWSTSPNPTISLSTKTTDSSGVGTFSSKLFGLSANTKYYVRAYATITSGTVYGNEVSFTTNDIDLKQGLVAYYPFSGNAGDSSGNMNHGTINGVTLTTDRFGNQNKAFSFNGTNSYIDVNDNTILRPKLLSLSAWYFTTTNNPAMSLISKNNYNNAANEQYFFGVSEAAVKLKSNCIPGFGWYYFRPNNILLGLNNWIHLVITWDGTILKLFKNGILQSGVKLGEGSTQIGNIDDCIGGKIQIGRHWTNDPRWFNGKIDDIRIYNRALNQQEITYLANN